MRLTRKFFMNLILAVLILYLLYFFLNPGINFKAEKKKSDYIYDELYNILEQDTRSIVDRDKIKKHSIHIFCVLTKIDTNASLKSKFQSFFESLVKYSNFAINLHVISDEIAQTFVEEVNEALENIESLIQIDYYDVKNFTDEIKDIVEGMQPHFSASSSYYSDALFYLSIGLHRIAPNRISKCILMDIDTEFRADPVLLWSRFFDFSPTNLIGLSPELSPVYRHILTKYRSKNNKSKIGNPSAEGGYSGYNSGVVLLHLERLRNSKLYNDLIQSSSVNNLTSKYSMHGHLGDQDFYTLLGIEHPELIYKLPCSWNRQLCTWWRNHGYADVFDRFFACRGKVNLYHGNCNTRIPN